jgi:hypothetical protein
MKTPLSAASLVQLLHQYYPSGLWCDDPTYEVSVEAQRLTRLLEQAQKDTHLWQSFVLRVGEQLAGCTLWETSLLWIDPCYRLRVSLPGSASAGGPSKVLICLVSLLAPAYVLYASHSLDTGSSTELSTCYPPLPPEFLPYKAQLEALIESTFEATRLPHEVLFTPVPGLAPRTGNVALGKARLIDLLFTPDRW